VRISAFSDGPRDATGRATTVIEVADDGPGFGPAILARAFERFARAERGRSSSAEESGAGLGLAIVAALVDAHGGTVTADNASALGGARVQVRLPAPSE